MGSTNLGSEAKVEGKFLPFDPPNTKTGMLTVCCCAVVQQSALLLSKASHETTAEVRQREVAT